MSPSTILPDRNPAVARWPEHHGAGPHQLAAAILRQLRRTSPDTPVSYHDTHGGTAVGAPYGPYVLGLHIDSPAGHAACPVLVPGTAPVPVGGAVAAAVDDDASSGMVVRYAHAEARRLDVPLRVVHVWTGSGAAATGARLLRHDRMGDADCLLATVLYENLPAAEADIAEREILHDPEPVRALTALSASLSLLVVAATAAAPARGQILGGTTGGLVGRTVCPLVVVPATEESAIW